ncbi:MAG: hypothetical protein GF401_18455 [Chitinivibrionales bacterium]|nr:hypothetical protein [Chitinivibrionales bacterium]
MAIVSFSQKYIFIKTRKTAGTSVQKTLRPFCKDGDIVTMQWTDIMTGTRCRVEEFASIEGIEQQFSVDRNEYFTFGFTRNPYSLALSRYFYQIKMNRIPGPPSPAYFNRWLADVYFRGEPGFPKGRYVKDRSRHLLFDANVKPTVDFIGKFENLQDDFTTITRRLALPDTELSHVNKSNHNNIHYRDWFDSRSIYLVQKHFDFELEYFNYAF